jgi:hypothetical protein
MNNGRVAVGELVSTMVLAAFPIVSRAVVIDPVCDVAGPIFVLLSITKVVVVGTEKMRAFVRV